MEMDNRDFSLDLVKAIAILMIVAIHVGDPFRNEIATLGAKPWSVLITIRMFSIQGVPLFFMASGFFLIGKQNESTGTFLKKRFSKLTIPFVLWSFAYWCWDIYCLGYDQQISDFPMAFVQGKIIYHFWFFYAIIAIYLATPILRVYAQNASRKSMLYFLVIWFIFLSLLPTLGIQHGIQVELFTKFLGYFLAGYLFRDIYLGRRQTVMAFIVVIGLSISLAVVTLMKTLANENLAMYWIPMHSLNPIIILNSFLSFIALRSVCRYIEFSGLIKRAVHTISITSFGIYILHVFVFFAVRPDGFVVLRSPEVHLVISWGVVYFLAVLIPLLITLLFQTNKYTRIFLP
jgi:surface polysaccharide O-acyltransferase-like enzyme